jgi:hypothetical protein
MKVRSGLTALGACTVMAAIAVGVAWAATGGGPPPWDGGGCSFGHALRDLDRRQEIRSFSGLTGISSGAEPAEYAQTNSTGQRSRSRFAGEPEAAFGRLSRGLTTSLEISAWHQSVLNGQLTAQERLAHHVRRRQAGRPLPPGERLAVELDGRASRRAPRSCSWRQ